MDGIIKSELKRIWDAIDAHKSMDLLRHEEENKSLDIANRTLDRRLANMNEYREQLDRERAHFLTREAYSSEHSSLASRVTLLELDKSSFKGGYTAIGLVLVILAQIVTIGVVVAKMYFIK